MRRSVAIAAMSLGRRPGDGGDAVVDAVMHDWLSPASVIGLWSAIAATLSAIVAWRVFRWQRKEARPTVTCELYGAYSHPEWIAIKVTIRNPTETWWDLRRLRFIHPSGLKGIAPREASARDPYGHDEFQPAHGRGLVSRDVILNGSVAPAGTNGQWERDQTWDEVYVERSALISERLELRITMVSREPVEQSHTVTVKRRLPPNLRAP